MGTGSGQVAASGEEVTYTNAQAFDAQLSCGSGTQREQIAGG